MRPGFIVLGITLAVLAAFMWPRADEGLESQSTDGTKGTPTTSGSMAAALGLAAVSALMFLQGFRPRSKTVAKALQDGRGP